jgi:hypothetical protein
VNGWYVSWASYGADATEYSDSDSIDRTDRPRLSCTAPGTASDAGGGAGRATGGGGVEGGTG